MSERSTIRPSQKQDGRSFATTRCRGSRCTVTFRGSPSGPVDIEEFCGTDPKSVKGCGLKGGKHDRDPQIYHPPRNGVLRTRRRSSTANYACRRNGGNSEPVRRSVRRGLESAVRGRCDAG